MMFHPSLKKLARLVDGETSASEAAKLSAHLGGCARCRGKVMALESMGSVLALARPLDEGFSRRLVSSLPEVRRETAPVVAEIRNTIGRVILRRPPDAEGFEAFPGLALHSGDTVCTARDAKALIQLKDGSSLYINNNTEIEFPRKTFSLSLLLGQFFALMMPQKRQFWIYTPAAALRVVGTEFDTRVEENEKTTLTVLKGKVAIKNQAGETVVKRKQRVEAGRNSPVVARGIRESRSITDWTSPLKPPKERKRISMRRIFIPALLILAGLAAWAVLSRRERSLWNLPAVELSRTDPVKLVSPYKQAGVSWRVRVRKENRSEGSWVPYVRVVTLTEVLEFDPIIGSRARITIESLVSDAEDPNEREAHTRLIGRQLEYRVALDGTVTALSFPGGKPLEGLEVLLFPINVIQAFLDVPYRTETAVPGDRWLATSPPIQLGHPNWYFRFDSDVEFAGYQRRGGIELAVIRERYQGTMGGGVPIQVESLAPDLRVVAELDRTDAQGVSTYFLDAASGRVLWMEESGTRGAVDLTVRKMVAGRPPKEEKLRRVETIEFRSFATVEYLPLTPT